MAWRRISKSPEGGMRHTQGHLSVLIETVNIILNKAERNPTIGNSYLSCESNSRYLISKFRKDLVARPCYRMS